MKKPTTDVRRYREAVEWFRKRTGLSDEDASKLLVKAARQAVVVANKGQLNMVLQAYRGAQKAKAAGVDFTEFRGKMAEQLKKDWGADGKRITALFRESVQRAYAQQRVATLTDPQMLKERPFWRYTSILDHRTSRWCNTFHGTTLPAHHPWWDTHTPPCHFNCRSTIIGMTPRQTKAYGLTKRPPKLRPEAWTSPDGDRLDYGKMDAQYKVDVRKMPKAFRRSYLEKVNRVKNYFKTPKLQRRRVQAVPLDKPDTHS